MELKLLAFVLLIVSGVVFAGEQDDCEEKEIKVCVARYREYASDDPSEKQACRQVKTFISCMKEGIIECGSGNDLMDEDFAELESLYKENCAAEHELSDDSKECFENNEIYLSACLADTMADMSEMVSEFEDDVDENILLCFTYVSTVNCMTYRINEKCGSQAGQAMEEALGKAPEEVQEACSAESTLKFVAKLFLGEVKKRR